MSKTKKQRPPSLDELADRIVAGRSSGAVRRWMRRALDDDFTPDSLINNPDYSIGSLGSEVRPDMQVHELLGAAGEKGYRPMNWTEGAVYDTAEFIGEGLSSAWNGIKSAVDSVGDFFSNLFPSDPADDIRRRSGTRTKTGQPHGTNVPLPIDAAGAIGTAGAEAVPGFSYPPPLSPEERARRAAYPSKWI